MVVARSCMMIVSTLRIICRCCPGMMGIGYGVVRRLRSRGGKSLLDEEIERNELRDHHDYMEAEEHSVGHHGVHQHQDVHQDVHQDGTHQHEGESPRDVHEEQGNEPETARADSHQQAHESNADRTKTPTGTLPYDVAEMFVFSYGVVVFWNLTERQEKDLLADLAFATSSVTGIRTNFSLNFVLRGGNRGCAASRDELPVPLPPALLEPINPPAADASRERGRGRVLGG